MTMSIQKFVNKVRAAFYKFGKSGKATAVILAGGSSNRLKECNTTKQMAEIDGIPLICRTITAFENTDNISDIILVAKEDEKEIYNDFIKKYGFKKISGIVTGGETRQQSVLNALDTLDDKSGYIAVHDGARCFVTPEMIDRVLYEAHMFGAAIAAERSTDTLKESFAGNTVKKTIDRECVWRAQTPQIFKKDIFITSAYYAKENNIKGTDDASLVEAAGFNVKLVDCGHFNMKITFDEDLRIAEALIKEGIVK